MGHRLIGKAVTDRQSCPRSICALAVVTAYNTLSVCICMHVCVFVLFFKKRKKKKLKTTLLEIDCVVSSHIGFPMKT